MFAVPYTGEASKPDLLKFFCSVQGVNPGQPEGETFIWKPAVRQK